MVRIIAAIPFAALLVCGATVAFGLTGTADVSRPQVALKGDRPTTRPIGPACSQAAWPNYESSCLRHAQSDTQPRQVRMIAIDRKPVTGSRAIVN